MVTKGIPFSFFKFLSLIPLEPPLAGTIATMPVCFSSIQLTKFNI